MADTNGDVKGRLRAARQRVRDQSRLREAIKLERSANVMESTGAYNPSPFDYINAYSIFLDRLRSEPWSMSITNPFDRKYGRNFPIYQSEPELSLLRAPSRVLCQTNCYAQALVGGLKSYIIGTGYTYRAVAREKAKVPPGLVEAIQEVVDRFCWRNQWNGNDPWQDLDQLPLRPIEGEAFERSLRDGEALVVHYADPESGDTDVRFVEPEFVTQPPNSSWEEYSFGWKVPRDDEQTKLAAWISWDGNPANGEEYPVRDLAYLTRNSDRIAKRGVPDFSFDAGNALQVAQRLRTALATGGAQKASIVGVRQHKAQTQAQVSTFQQTLADLVNTNLVTGAQQNVRLFDPGTWEDIPENLEYVSGPSTANEGALVEVLNACLRGAVVRWNGFEWLVSADASSNSYANALAAESPAVRRVDSEQHMYEAFFGRSFAIAVRNACDAGRVRVGGTVYDWQTVRRLVEIQIEAPSPEVRDKAGEAQRDTAMFQAGLKSPQTICQEQGLDYEREMKNLEEHRKKFPPQPLGGPGAMPAPGANPPAAGGGSDEPPQPPEPPELPDLGESALESALFESGFSGTITDKLGHKRTYVDGKQVAGNRDPGAGPQQGAKAADRADPRTAKKIAARKQRRAVYAAVATAAEKTAAAAGVVVNPVKYAAKKIGSAVWDALPNVVKAPFVLTYRVVHAVESAIEKVMPAAQTLALQAAKERGLSDKHAIAVARICAAVDTASRWTGNVPGAHEAIHGLEIASGGAAFALAKLGYYIPVGSMAYLAYSTARNPFAVGRAARKLVTGQGSKIDAKKGGGHEH